MPDVSFATDGDRSTSRSLLTFVGPYIDAVIIIPYMKICHSSIQKLGQNGRNAHTGGIDITEQDIQNTGA